MLGSFKKYLSTDEVAEIAGGPDWGIVVQNAGHGVHLSGMPYPGADHPSAYELEWQKGRRLQEFQLVYIAAGQGEFEAENVGTVTVKPGTVFFLFPGTWHRYRPHMQTGWEEYWIGFSGVYAGHLMRQDCFRQKTPLIDIGFSSVFADVFLKLFEAFRSATLPGASQIVSCYAIQLLGLVYSSALQKQNRQTRKENIINNIRYRMHEQWADNFSLELFASQHNVSYAWFRKAFKEVTGVSPGQYILNIRFEKANRLLSESELTIAEIAFSTGFPSEQHFCSLYKKKHGRSPGEYRKYQKT